MCLDNQLLMSGLIVPTGIREQERQLDTDIARYRRLAYSANTQQTYRSQRNAYYRFCLYFGYDPIPATPTIVCRYACFLARTLSPDSIACYLNVLRILHLESGLENPLGQNWRLTTTMRGIKKAHGRPQQAKLPITPDILRAIGASLDMSLPQDLAMWAACTCAFFTFFRKSTLLPKSSCAHDCRTELCRQDVKFEAESATLNVKQTKTL